jgi:hypothetical protein
MSTSPNTQVQCVFVPHDNAQPLLQVTMFVSDLLAMDHVVVSTQQEISPLSIYASFDSTASNTNMYLAGLSEEATITGGAYLWGYNIYNHVTDYLLEVCVQNFQF